MFMFIDQLARHWVGVVKTTAKVCREFRGPFSNLNVTIQSLPQGTVPLYKQTGSVHERIKSFLAVSRLCICEGHNFLSAHPSNKLLTATQHSNSC